MSEENKQEELTPKSIFDVLSQIDVSKYSKKKPGAGGRVLSYLPWANAWYLLKKHYPEANYRIIEHEKLVMIPEAEPVVEKLPYTATSAGVLVKVAVMIGNLHHIVQLPVLDDKQNSQKLKEYTITRTNRKTGETYDTVVKAADMQDINSTIQRALVKACAFFGLGLDQYMGEEFADVDDDSPKYKVIFSGVTFDSKEDLKSKVPGVRYDKEYKVWRITVKEAKLIRLKKIYPTELPEGQTGITIKYQKVEE